jgi:small multidrug resistance pump
MGWVFLILAIALEIGGTLSMKAACGFTKLGPSLSVFICYGFCLGALTLAIERIEMSVVYAVWAGVGTAVVAILGVTFYGERLDFVRIISIGLIILGVVGLNLQDIVNIE